MADIRIQNNTISASHEPLTKLKPSCRLTADTAAGSGSVNVGSTYGFSIGQTLLIGNFGDPTAEIIQAHAATAPTATVITFASNTVYDHYVDTPVTVIDYTQIEFYKAATLAGSKTIIGSAVNIQPNRKETTISDLTDTGYAFFRYKTAGAAFSSYSDGVPFATNADNTVEIIVAEACRIAREPLFGDYTKEDALIYDINDCQDYISQARDWVFEQALDTNSVSLDQGQNTYDISTLITNLKYPLGKQGFMRIMVGNNPLRYIEPEDMDGYYAMALSSSLLTAISPRDTSVVLVSSDSFPSSGTIDIGENLSITYTANNKATNTLSGVPVTGSGSIATAEAAGMLAITGKTQATPRYYTYYDGELIVDCPVDSNNDGINLKIKFLKKLTAATSFSSTTLVPFYRAMPLYVAYKIERRKRNWDEADKHMADFNNKLAMNAQILKMPTQDVYYAYNLSNTAPNDNDNTNRIIVTP